MENQPEVIIVMGSKSDWDVMKNSAEQLKSFDVKYDARVLSAHRTPAALEEYLKKVDNGNLKVIIAAAGLAAHLAGVIASLTTTPILAVPMDAGSLGGVDALYSMVQMPPGIPVATMGIGKPGAVNAALYAVAILALENPAMKQRLLDYRKGQAQKVLETTLELP